MKMYEFGLENAKTILMLHGAGCTYKMWTPQIAELEKNYHLYVPSISGHEQDDIDFESSDKEAEIILDWFQQHDINQIDVICGASLGAHVAVSIMQKAPAFAKYAFVESLKGYQYHGLILRCFCSIGAYFMRKCANTKGYMAGCYEQKHASDDCKMTIKNTNIFKNQVNECKVVEIPGYHHGELAIGNSEEHVKRLHTLLSQIE